MCRSINEQLLAVMSSISVLLADQNQSLLLEMHAGVIDMLLGMPLSQQKQSFILSQGTHLSSPPAAAT
jgi:hypothetical protein